MSEPCVQARGLGRTRSWLGSLDRDPDKDSYRGAVIRLANSINFPVSANNWAPRRANAGPASATLAQHSPDAVPEFRVAWVVRRQMASAVTRCEDQPGSKATMFFSLF